MLIYNLRQLERVNGNFVPMSFSTRVLPCRVC